MTRHRLDLFSLLSGLVLTGIAFAALFGVSTTVAGWVWPTVLVVLGVIVVVAAIGTSTTTAEEDDAPAAPGEPDVDPDRATALAAARVEVEDADHTTPHSSHPDPTD